MEKFNKKTLIIIAVLAVLVIAGIVCLALFNSNGKKASEEELEKVTTVYDEVIFSLTEGYPTQYGGLDVLYDKEELTYDDLNQNVILNAAVKYASNNLENSISSATIDKIKNTYGYDLSKYAPYDAHVLEEAVKLLFGKDLEIGTVENDNTYGYEFLYLPAEQIYLKSTSPIFFGTDNTHNVKTKVIDTVNKNNKIEITVIVTYAHTLDGKLVYTSDKNANQIVFETTLNDGDIKEEHIEKFNKYVITFGYNEEGDNYTFESVKKAK